MTRVFFDLKRALKNEIFWACAVQNNPQKRPRPYRTYYRCEECSMEKEKCIWLCNTRKNIDGNPQVVCCHLKYHLENPPETTGSTEYSVDSDLTDQS